MINPAPESPSATGTPAGSTAQRGESCPGHTSILLVDDHPPVRKAIEGAVENTMDLEVTGVAGTIEEARTKMQKAVPDVVIVDISMPDGHGFDLVKRIREEHPEAQVLVFSMYDETVYAERALRAGSSGYLMKTEPIPKLLEAIRSVERGEVYLSRSMTTRILEGQRGGDEPSFAIDDLSDREFQVFRLLGEGKALDDIQEQLDLSKKTIETYRRRAKEKLGFDSVSELLQHAVQWVYVQKASDLEVQGHSAPSSVEDSE